MSVGIVLVLVWFACVASLLVWQFASHALDVAEPQGLLPQCEAPDAAECPAELPAFAPALRPLPVGVR